MPVLTWKTYIIVLPMVFLASLIDAVGGGGGLISLPAYTLAGLPYGYASGCNKFSASFGTLSATIRYYRSGRIRMKAALLTAAGALPGAWIGTRVSLILSQRFMQIFMICAIPCVAAFMLLKKEYKGQEKPLTLLNCVICVLVGLFMGFYDGFFGPGTGTFLILIFNALLGMDMVSASASSKVVNLSSNITSLITRIAAGQVIFALAIPAMALSVCGAQLGSKLALTKGARFIRYVMLLVLALLIVKLAVDLF